MKKICAIILLTVILAGCEKEDKEFNLNTIKLIAYENHDYPAQNLKFLIIDGNNGNQTLASTDSYPDKLPLPVVMGISRIVKTKLYKDSFIIQLWGETSGLIASTKIDMNKYKIMFPIEMEVENKDITVSITGSWK